METKTIRIVFMGTPDFAVRILDELVTNNIEIAGVITAPDKPAGRGQQLQHSAVKEYALKKQLHILQPTSLKDETFLANLKALNADLFVVVAFRMLPEVVWTMPPKGTINLHASLLPNYRGAAPINWAIIHGETQTGVTTFFIDKEIDTGKIIERATIPIGENETVGELHDRLMELGAQLTLSTIIKIKENNAVAIDQLSIETATLKHAPKIFKPDCEINWKQPVTIVHNFIRGLSPYPAAWCKLINSENGEQKTIKLFHCTCTEEKVTNPTAIISDKESIYFPCADYYLKATEIQLEGKRKMDVQSFLAGNSLKNWQVQ